MSAHRFGWLAPWPTLTLAAALVSAGAVPPAAAQGPRPPASAEPTATRTMANGMVVAMFQDDRQPLVQIQLLVPAGSIEEASGESGLANLTFQMLGHGTASRTGAAFDEAVQALGGSVGGAVSREFATLNGTFLAADMEAGLELLTDAVVNPIFGEDVLQAIKAQAASGLERARANPATLADDHLWAAVFQNHPYGPPALGAPQVLSTFSVAQVEDFHRRHYRPDRSLLAIAGDVTPERAFKAVEEQLGPWGGRAIESGPDSLLPPQGFRVRIVDVPQLDRAQLRLGVIGPARTDAEYEPLVVAAELLSAGAAGLDAGVSGLREAGLFSVAWSAAVDSAAASVKRARAALSLAERQPPSDADLAVVKRRLLGVAALQLDTRGGAMAQWMAGILYPRPAGGTSDYAARLSAITAAGVREALARRVPPDAMALVAVGPADRLRPQLQALGAIEVVPAEAAAEVVESPATARGVATAEQGIRGRALAAQALAAHGGLERLRGVRDSRIEGDMVMMPGGANTLSGRIVQVRKDPDRFRFETAFSVFKSVQVLDGQSGWSRAGDPPAPVEDADSVSVEGLRTGLRSDIVHLLLSAADPATRVAWRGQERRDDRDADVVELLSADGVRRLLFLDITSHRLIAAEQNDNGRSVRRVYRDLRDANGVLWPYFEERYLDGQHAVTLTLSKVAINTGVSDAEFVKPGTKPSAPGKTSRPPRPR